MTLVRFSLEWDDVDEAEFVAQTLWNAAHRGEKIVDHGLLKDAQELFEQIEAYYEERDSE